MLKGKKRMCDIDPSELVVTKREPLCRTTKDSP